MRKLLALVATVAMVLGMFSGVAFAEAGVPDTIIADDAIYITDSGQMSEIIGQVLDDEDYPVANVWVELLEDDATLAMARTNSYGEFVLPFVDDADMVGTYTLKVRGTGVNGTEVVKKISIVPELDSDDSLNLLWPDLQDNDFVFEYFGKLAFAGDYKYVVLTVGDDYDDHYIGYTSLAKNGAFYLNLGKDAFGGVKGADDVKLWITKTNPEDEIAPELPLLIATGKLSPGKVSFKMSTNSLVYDVSQTLKVDVTGVGNLHLSTPFRVKLYIVDDAGNVRSDLHAGFSYDKTTTADFTRTFSWAAGALKPEHTGAYSVVLELTMEGKTAYRGSADFTVGRPTVGKLYGMPTNKQVHEGLRFQLGQGGVYVLYRAEGKYRVAPYYKISTSGLIETKETDFLGDDDNNMFDAQKIPTKAGVVTVTVKAYSAKDDNALIGTYTADVVFEGGVMTVDVPEVEVEYKGKVTFTVVDDEGKPVNNAYIYFVGIEPAIVSPYNVNIINGEYTVDFSLKDNKGLVAAPKAYTVEARQAGKKIAATTFKVVGQEIYNVVLDKEAVLAGETNQTITATVTNADGDVVIPAKIKLSYTDPSKFSTKELVPTRVDTDKDGVRESVRFTVPKLTNAGTYTVTVTTGAQDQYLGKATFEAKLPELNLDVEKVTNNVKSSFSFTLTDPLTGKPLDWDVVVKGDTYTDLLDEAKLNGENIEVYNNELNLWHEDEYNLVVLVNADLKQAADNKRTAAVTLEAEGVTLAKLPVVDATLAADKDTLVIGTPNTVTLTLTDANGKPLEGYKVECGSWSDKTNENGQVIYTIAYVGNDPIDFVATLDAKVDNKAVTLKKTIKTGVDFDAPVVTYEPVVGLPETTITITDNVRLQRVRVNGVELDFFATASLEHVVKGLQLGDNKIVVEAQDINGNSMKQEITIEYKGIRVPAENQTRRGDFILVQVRQFEDLGVVCDWDPETRTATFTYEENVVQVTIGSSIAVVNGEQVELDVAAEIIGDRTFVPTRFVGESLGLSVHWQPGDIVTIGV